MFENILQEAQQSSGDWTKAFIGSFVGLIAGLVADPLKTALTEHRKVKRISKTVHFEIANFENDVIQALAIVTTDPKMALYSIKKLSFPRLKEFLEKDGELFLQHKKLAWARGFYEKAIEWSATLNSTENVATFAHDSITAIKMLKLQGKLDVALLDEWAKENRNEAFDDAIATVKALADNEQTRGLAKDFEKQVNSIRSRLG